MRIRLKLVIAFLFTGLSGAIIVAGLAYWLIVRDFSASIEEQAFSNFKLDVQHYLKTYGGLQQALESEPFHLFVHRKRAQVHPVPKPPHTPQRTGTPPFKFLLIKPSGEVVNPGEAIPKVSEETLGNAYPIELNGEIAVYASPIGKPIYNSQDLVYIEAVKHSLITGVIVASVIAILLGFFLGNSLTRSLKRLTGSIKSMQKDKEGHFFVSNSSNDEIGDVTRAFNQMNKELSKAHRELRELSIKDELTGLYNRRHFEEQAQKAFDQAIRYNTPLTVMIGDLDHFKRVNDSFSHTVGDQVLEKIGMILACNIRKSDIVARYGGEEFAIFFPNTSLDQAITSCENLRKIIQNYDWSSLAANLSVTMSMGVCSDLSTQSVEKMIHIADQNLLVAKQCGRNQLMDSLLN